MSSNFVLGKLLRTRALLLAVGAASTLGLAACGGGGGGDTVSVATPSVTALAALESAGALTLTNPATGALFTGTAVTVTLTSSVPNVIVDAAGNALTSVTTSNGIAGFFLKAGTDPATTPVVVRAAVLGAAFVPKTVEFSFSAKGTLNQNLEVIALPTTAGAITTGDAGVNGAAQVGTATSAGGVTTTTGATTVTVNPVGATGTTVTIPAGTQLTTSTGTAAAAGNVVLTAVAFSPTTTDGLGEFPGGFAAGGPGGTALATAGFVTLRLRDSAGNLITNFSQPVQVSMDIPSTTPAIGGGALTVGVSTYPIYRYDVATTSWVFESNGSVAADNGDGTYRVDFTTSSFSTRAALAQLPACSAQTITVPSTATDLTATIESTTSPAFLFKAQVNNGALRVPAAPTGREAIVKVYQNGVVVSQQTFANLCAGSLTMPALSGGGTTGTVTINTTESCADGSNTRALASVLVSVIKDSDGYTESGSTNASGTVSFTFPTGTAKTYAISPRSGTSYQKSVTVTSGQTSTVTYDFLMSCGNITGTGGAISQLP